MNEEEITKLIQGLFRRRLAGAIGVEVRPIPRVGDCSEVVIELSFEGVVRWRHEWRFRPDTDVDTVVAAAERLALRAFSDAIASLPVL